MQGATLQEIGLSLERHMVKRPRVRLLNNDTTYPCNFANSIMDIQRRYALMMFAAGHREQDKSTAETE
jgi:hypothetical protein